MDLRKLLEVIKNNTIRYRVSWVPVDVFPDGRKVLDAKAELEEYKYDDGYGKDGYDGVI